VTVLFIRLPPSSCLVVESGRISSKLLVRACICTQRLFLTRASEGHAIVFRAVFDNPRRGGEFFHASIRLLSSGPLQYRLISSSVNNHGSHKIEYCGTALPIDSQTPIDSAVRTRLRCLCGARAHHHAHADRLAIARPGDSELAVATVPLCAHG
jgi:hypothetical protein